MKKIPTVFVKNYNGREYLGLTREFTSPECENAFLNGIATVKMDGSAVAVIDGKLYARYDARLNKHGNPKAIPENAIPCCERDAVTGHLPCWIPADSNSRYKWQITAFENYKRKNGECKDGTYEAIGPHFQNNPYGLQEDMLYRHGTAELHDVPRDFDGVKEWLTNRHYLEGIVFWFNNEPVCKIRRHDFMLDWND